MSDAKPYPKAAQLARGERRYRRKVATAQAWQKIVADKLGPCRVCVSPAANAGYDASSVQPWRIVEATTGREIWTHAGFDHPNLGWTTIPTPLAFARKRDAVAALAALASPKEQP